MISTLGSDEPSMQTFASALAQYDRDKDGRLSLAEVRSDPVYGEHFGWIDESGGHIVIEAEWNTARSLGSGDWGAIAVRPGSAECRLVPEAIFWRFQRNLSHVPAPLLYRDVYYMVRTGGIVTSLDPATGRMLKQGRSPDALGEHYASPVAADGKVFPANVEGRITVLQAAAEREVLGVNDLAEEIHAAPALSDGRIYVRTRDALHCFSAPRVSERH